MTNYRLAFFLIFLTSLIACKTEEPQNTPTVITKAASDVSQFSATLNGEVIDEGFTAATDRGFVYSDKNTNPSVSDAKVQSGFGKGVYLVNVDKLSLNTKYYFNAYSTNSKGTSYGVVQSFTTSDYKIPTVSTDAPINITHFSTDMGGNIIETGGLIVTERGICYGLNPNPTTSDIKVVSGEGKGVFKITIPNLKDNTKYYMRAYAINSKGTAYGNEQTINTLIIPVLPRDNTTKVVEVVSKTGRVWMDRNLGALQAATSPTDEKSFGDYYQWGRGYDGHQLYNSNISEELSISDTPGNKFITTAVTDWRKTPNDKLWQGVDGVNNPCPKGFRIPTESEWLAESNSWISKDINGAFASPLKLPIAGTRYPGNGKLGKEGADYHSSTTIYFEAKPHTRAFKISFFTTDWRSDGQSVRCIKD